MSDTVRVTGFEENLASVQAIKPQTASGVTPITSASIDLSSTDYARKRILVVGSAICGNLPTVTTTQATNVVNSTGHGLVAGDAVVFTALATTTGITVDTVTYYVIASGLTANAFKVSTTAGGSTITMGGGDGTATAHAVGVIGNLTVTESATSGGSYAAATTSAGTAPTSLAAAASGSIGFVSVRRNAAKPFIKVTWTAVARGQTTLVSASVVFVGDGL